MLRGWCCKLALGIAFLGLTGCAEHARNPLLEPVATSATLTRLAETSVLLKKLAMLASAQAEHTQELARLRQGIASQQPSPAIARSGPAAHSIALSSKSDDDARARDVRLQLQDVSDRLQALIQRTADLAQVDRARLDQQHRSLHSKIGDDVLRLERSINTIVARGASPPAAAPSSALPGQTSYSACMSGCGDLPMACTKLCTCLAQCSLRNDAKACDAYCRVGTQSP